jgi:hypothetical protein
MKTYIIIITTLFSINLNAVNFEKALIKEYEKSTYIWVLMSDIRSNPNNNLTAIKEINKQITDFYAKENKKTVILYMNDIKAVPPTIDSEKHAESIVMKSLTSNIMRLYFVAFCETKKPTADVIFKPVDILLSMAKMEFDNAIEGKEKE